MRQWPCRGEPVAADESSWLDPRLEADVQTRQEVPYRRLRKEIGGREVVLARLVQLRVEPLVIRPRRQVAARERQSHRTATDLLCPFVWCIHAHRDLAQLHKAAVLDVPSLGGVKCVRHRCRLIRQRRLRIVYPLAIQESTPELFGGVEQPVAEPTVEQAVERDPVPDIELGADRPAVVRVGAAEEY